MKTHFFGFASMPQTLKEIMMMSQHNQNTCLVSFHIFFYPCVQIFIFFKLKI